MKRCEPFKKEYIFYVYIENKFTWQLFHVTLQGCVFFSICVDATKTTNAIYYVILSKVLFTVEKRFTAKADFNATLFLNCLLKST